MLDNAIARDSPAGTVSDSRAKGARTIRPFHKMWSPAGPKGLLSRGDGRGRRRRCLRSSLPARGLRRRRSWRTRRLLRRRRLGGWGGGCRVGGRGRGGGRGIVGRLDRVVLGRLFHRAKLCNVLLMLVVGLGEGVTAGAIGDEIEVAGARRVGGGLERGAAGIGDRPGRQAVDHIGIVGRGLGNFAALDWPPQRALAADHPV